MGVNQSDLQSYPIDAIAPLSPVRRIERKGKKKSPTLGSWREIFMEKLAGVGLASVVSVEESSADDVSVDDGLRPEPAVTLRSADGRTIVVETEEDFRRVLAMIQHLADDPIMLLESHLNLFIDPAPPGKVLNSAG